MIVDNANGRKHAAAIAELLGDAEEVVIAVAFLKKGGADHVAPMLEKRLAAGAKVRIFVGTDFFLTEPAALDRLLKAKSRHPALVIKVADRSSATFHPKLYSARKAGDWRTLVGSANLTRGALRSNEELSLLIKHGPDDELTRQLVDTVARYDDWDRLQTLDPLVLEQYRSLHEIDRGERERYEKARDEALPKGFDLRTIDDWHRRHLADPATAKLRDERRRSRAKALTLQRSIAALAGGVTNASARKTVREGLGDLMGSAGGMHLWGSGNIPRQGSKALDHPKGMIRLFALAEEASGLAPREGYARIKRTASEAPGVGLNMVTEILCTFAPTRYAVFNGNTVGALGALGIATPRYARLDAIGPDRYQRLCDTIRALGRRIGAADLSEADAFLNWVYWTKKRQANPTGG